MMFQKLCCEGKGWDERTGDSNELEFLRWIEGAKTIAVIFVDRWYCLGCEDENLLLVGFYMCQGKVMLHVYIRE